MTTKTFKCNRCGTDCILIIEGESAKPITCQYSVITTTEAEYVEMVPTK